MDRIIQKIFVYLLIGSAFLSPAKAVVLHPDGEPNLVTWTNRPSDDVIGRWSSNASCIAISPDCVITTRHQGGGINTPVEIAGILYSVEQVWNHNTADLRIAKLRGANLANYADIYQTTDEVRKSIVIAGFGDGRDQLLQKQGITYGYDWDNSTNTTLRFGSNIIDRVENDSNFVGLVSDIVTADFDRLGDRRSTVYECISADHDSGGGWFINVAGIWKLAGLSRTVEVHYEPGHEGDPNYFIYDQSWFRDSTDPNLSDPDYLDAVRISSYADWLLQTIPEYVPGDLTDDGWTDFSDFAFFSLFWLDIDCSYPDWCAGADFEPDGDVDLNDLAFLLNAWLSDPTY